MTEGVCVLEQRWKHATLCSEDSMCTSRVQRCVTMVCGVSACKMTVVVINVTLK